MFELDMEKIPYQISDEFYKPEELEDICLKVHKKVEQFCDFLDNLILDNYADLKKCGIRPILFHISPITILFDGIISRIYKLQCILDHYSTYNIFIHLGEEKPWGIFGITFSRQEALWGKILSLSNWNIKVNFLPDPEIKGKSHIINAAKAAIITFAKKFAKKSIFVSNIVHNIKDKNLKGMLALFSLKTKQYLLVHNYGNELSYLVPDLSRKGWKIFFTNDLYFFTDDRKIRKKDKPHIMQIIESRSEFLDFFQFDNISFYHLLKKRIYWLAESAPCLLQNAALKMQWMLKKNKITAVLTQSSATGISHTIRQVACYHDVPVFNWQHGLISSYKGGITQLYEYEDLMTADIVLAFGEPIAKLYDQYQSKFPTKVFSVGSTSLDNISRRASNCEPKGDNKKTKILYVTNSYYQNTWYYGFTPPYSDCSFYRDQLYIVNELKVITHNFKDVSATIKLHPTSFADLPSWRSTFREDERLKIINAKPKFSELLFACDVVIIDLATTTLLHGVATKLPVFVLMRHYKYPEDITALLSRRAVCVDDVQTLIASVRNYLQSGVYPADLNDNAFLKKYGNHLDDGKSKERVLKVFNNIIKQKNPV